MPRDIEQLESMANWMDSRFKLPFIPIRIGMDSLIGLLPVIGDSMSFISTAYILGKAQRYHLPLHIKARIVWNGFIDWLIGSIPLIGDIFDIGWKANLKNVALIKAYLSNADANIHLTGRE